jgi:hypothetical protein
VVRDDIECTFHGASGTQLGNLQKTIYQSFPSNGTKRVSDFSLGFINQQAASASCKLIGVRR